MQEEQLKNKIAERYFKGFDTTNVPGKIDFTVCVRQGKKEQTEPVYLLWAEAKSGTPDIYDSIVQLILTIGKARTFDQFLPPPLLGAFDSEKIAFIPYSDIHDVFYMNDFNWSVTPSDHTTKEFKLVLERVKSIIDSQALVFNFERDEKELKKFIKNNFIADKFPLTKTRIDKNNFMIIYSKWLQTVKPTIAVNWDIVKKSDIIDGDFYLADLLSRENVTLKDKLFVLLKNEHYELNREVKKSGLFSYETTGFNDGQKAHIQFWNKYERPPKEEYWDYIVKRRDLLVPQDIRERKGSFFTPQIWVELSQRYLMEALGENWQDEYYIWDCAAGTGNLLAGLTNKWNIWASTLDKADVDVMHDRINTMNDNSISGEGSNLLHDHVFQFDFLNDDFSKLPQPLQVIINDPEERKKLVVYINPPYKRGKGVANTNWHKEEMGQAKDELFAQFIFRIYREIPNCLIAEFSKLKILQAPNFKTLRNLYLAKLVKMFIVPADTFDNVEGKFPIGFKIWKTDLKEVFKEIYSDVYNDTGLFLFRKLIFNYDDYKMINEWLNTFSNKQVKENKIGFINSKCNDFQHQNRIAIGLTNILSRGDVHKTIDENNLTQICIYFAVRHCIEPSWINDRDQFLFPNDGWEKDSEFQSDCLAFALFHGQNRINSSEGTNHWIPFTEDEVNSREKFDSNFMTDFIKGKIGGTDLFASQEKRSTPLEFSEKAKAVFDAGRELWKYYHEQPNCNVNASLYDIREHFQGRDKRGRMNNRSDDETYMELIGNLRDELKQLAEKIEPKVYEYGFLK